MSLSRVEESRWFSWEWLTRLPHISSYPHSVHVRPSAPHSSMLHPLVSPFPSSVHFLLPISHRFSLFDSSPSIFSPFPIVLQSLFAHVHIHHLPFSLSVYFTPTTLLLHFYIPCLLTAWLTHTHVYHIAHMKDSSLNSSTAGAHTIKWLLFLQIKFNFSEAWIEDNDNRTVTTGTIKSNGLDWDVLLFNTKMYYYNYYCLCVLVYYFWFQNYVLCGRVLFWQLPHFQNHWWVSDFNNYKRCSFELFLLP